MRPLLYVLSFLAVIASGFWAYRENYSTQESLKEVSRLNREIGSLREGLALQRAEWAYLNRPDRLRDLVVLNFDKLGLLPLEPEQLGGTTQIAYPKAPRPPELTGAVDTVAETAPAPGKTAASKTIGAKPTGAKTTAPKIAVAKTTPAKIAPANPDPANPAPVKAASVKAAPAKPAPVEPAPAKAATDTAAASKAPPMRKVVLQKAADQTDADPSPAPRSRPVVKADGTKTDTTKNGVKP